MAILNIPVSDGPDVVQRVSLEGVVYDFRYRWNTRSEAWYLYLGLTGEEYSFKLKLTTGQDLLLPYRYSDECPPGQLYMMDVLKSYGRPTRDEFGQDKRFRLLYVTSDTDLSAVLEDLE